MKGDLSLINHPCCLGYKGEVGYIDGIKAGNSIQYLYYSLVRTVNLNDIIKVQSSVETLIKSCKLALSRANPQVHKGQHVLIQLRPSS